ncbi:FadR/GntR family transcriptional regulator [Rhodococcus sp. JVH1]|uniref:FadR/GntR family transcriptional regulator n=1 Tax=Rhodococcus sp. JVH1 TaxID=745408 RepID=UPI0002721356|nr:FadR/GntR family transcriptional regulator [Rhodococcus sp. JVH1]EJI95756.1 transcriptional regulator, GntR family [Rhodococcus sp. JVH1]
MTSQSTQAAPPTSDGSGDLYHRITPGRVSGMIVDQIRLLIREGQVKPGERLPSERDLGEKFGVSRVSVREALRGLEASGLVTIKVGAGGGAFVTAPTSAQVGEGIVDLLAMSMLTPAEVTEARQVFELGIIPLVCERADEQDIAELLEICDRGDAALADGSYPMSLSAEFHSRVARATHNAAIVMLADSFQGPTRRSLEQVKEEHPEMGVRGNKEHRQFVAAVSKRDTDKATAVMRTHIARTARHVAKGK